MKKEIPIWEKSNLTIEEAAAYSGIGENRLRELTCQNTCTFVLWVEKRGLLSGKKLDEFTENSFSL